MAEELGHIDIRFPSTPGGGAGETTGPLPSKVEMPDMGASMSSMMRAAAGDFTAIAKMIVSNVLSVASSIKQFVESAVSDIRERGKFSPDVMMENVAMKLQGLSNQFQEARVLGPLYAMVLRWYRELMQLLQPWKLLLQTIIAFLSGIILATIKQLMTIVNKGLDSLLQLMTSMLQTVAAYLIETIEKPSLPVRLGGQMVAGAIGQSQYADLISLVAQRALFGPITRAVVDLAEASDKALKELRGINNNTTKKTNTGIDWAAAQLREIASRSQYRPTNPFWHPGGVGSSGRGYP